jgi:hypothetical protein
LNVDTILSLAGGLAIVVSAFLPWLRVGDVTIAGTPDPAGYFVLALGVASVIASLASSSARKAFPFLMMLAGIAAITTLAVVWRNGPGTVGDRALARAEALALVDNVPMEAPPPVGVGAGVFLGIGGGVVVTTAGLLARRTSRR